MADQDLVDIINLSDYEGSYKAVQLFTDGKPALILGPSVKSMHYELLKFFLSENNLNFKNMIAPGS